MAALPPLMPTVEWLSAHEEERMKKLVDHAFDDHPRDDPERACLAWSVALIDDCEECQGLRVELTVEEAGGPGTGLVGHLSPPTARRLRAALAAALREVGERTEA